MTSEVRNKEVFSTPKRGNILQKNRASWYEYYAGYSSQFALDVIKSLAIEKSAVVLDPWNGIGTTTFAASAAGHLSKGFDLSPAPIVISKALNVSAGDKQSILPLTKEITSRALKFKKSEEYEPLHMWFDAKASNAIRSVEKAIQVCLVRVGNKEYAPIYFDVDSISEIAAFFYLALFKVVRALIKKFTGSNPTWIKKAKKDFDKISSDFAFVKQCFESEINLMLESFEPLFNSHLLGKIELAVGDSTKIVCDDNSVDCVISSPPYCTRIDYAVYMMPELAILGFADDNFNNLRRKLIGATTVPSVQQEIAQEWGQKCNVFLKRLQEHTSVSSASYYLKNHIQYFDLMFKSMSEISRVMRPQASCVLVVQDSYYKEIHTELPTIVSDMAYSKGLGLRSMVGFSARNNMAEINKGSKKYRSSSSATESVLFFQKY